MEESFHDLDPDGDVVIILRNPNVAFAIWDESSEYPPPETASSPSLQEWTITGQFDGPLEELVQPESEPEPEPVEPESIERGFPSHEDQVPAPEASGRWEEISNQSRASQSGYPTPPLSESPTSQDKTPISLHEITQEGMHIRVSSSHIILASPYFKRMFKGNWKETHVRQSGRCVPIYMEDWDPEALLILMNIIHGHTRKVPRVVSLEMLAKIAVLVDYYKCYEVVELFSEVWIDQLKGDLPTVYSRDVILWILVAWVFTQPEQFQAATRIAQRQSSGPIPTLGLPIPGNIVGMHPPACRLSHASLFMVNLCRRYH
jgi:hypothetical protein